MKRVRQPSVFNGNGELSLKSHPLLLTPLLSFLIVGLALGQTFPGNVSRRSRRSPPSSLPSTPQGQTYSTNIRYQPGRVFPSLREKIGTVLGIASCKDDRFDKPYVGHQYVGYQPAYRGVPGLPPLQASNYFKSEPSPLEKAIRDFISQAVSGSGVKTIPIPDWDTKPESLKNMEPDSILKIEIKRFWTEGFLAAQGTKLVTYIYLVIHLGVKKEGKVFTRNVYTEKESKVGALTPAEVELVLNGTLAEILDDFFSNPY